MWLTGLLRYLTYSGARGRAFSRRDVLKLAAAAPAAVGLGATVAALTAPVAAAAPLGVLLDYAAGVIPASDIRASGAAGAIRYVSDRRPGGQWMLGKPILLPEARDLYQNGLKIVSCYQYRQAGHRRLARRAGRRGGARQTRLAVTCGGGWLLWRTDLCLDRRRSD